MLNMDTTRLSTKVRFNMKFRPALLLLLAVFLSNCTKEPVVQVPIWDRWEITFDASEVVGPAQDVDFQIMLTAPGGKQVQWCGFWDGASTWKVRFMPDEEGTWSYTTASVPSIPGLDDINGSFESIPAQNEENRFLKHGSIKVSENGRHFVHADGTPFLWLGDTAWNGALKSTEEAWDAYLSDRVEKGFTGIQFVTTQWRAADGNAENEIAYTGFETIQINPGFFKRIDDRIDAVNAAGLLAAPVLLWTLGEPERNPGKLPEDQATKLARYLTARYGAHHVMWLLAGDENFGGETGERWRRIGRAVFDGYNAALKTFHPQGRQWFFDDFAEEDWLDLIIYQSSHGGGPQTLGWLQTGPPAQKWKTSPVRPVLNSEPGYEDHIAWEIDRLHTADDVRKQFYWSLLNTPVAGLTYGAHGIWSWETEQAVPLNHNGSGLAKPWNEAMQLPGSEQMKYVADLFNSFKWQSLRPVPELISNQSDNPFAYIGGAASEAGDLALFYLPQGGALVLTDDRLLTDTNAQWFNPRTGSMQSATISGSTSFTAPDTNDWVLLLQK